MNPIRRELLNGLLVLVVASLLSVAFSAFQVSFDAHLWVLILMGIAIAVSGYIVFEIGLGFMASTETREKEWLRRVGTPARLDVGVVGAESPGLTVVTEAVKAMSPGSDLTMMYYAPRGGNERLFAQQTYERFYSAVIEALKRGTMREYKRIICFDQDVLSNDHELKSGVLRVGEGPGTIPRHVGDHCRLMMETKGCSLYVAPVVFRAIVGLIGADKVSMTVETTDQNTGGRAVLGIILFCDPPNGEIVEQFRQIERSTEKRMVAVHKIVFPEHEQSAAAATR